MKRSLQALLSTCAMFGCPTLSACGDEGWPDDPSGGEPAVAEERASLEVEIDWPIGLPRDFRLDRCAIADARVERLGQAACDLCADVPQHRGGWPISDEVLQCIEATRQALAAQRACWDVCDDGCDLPEC